MAGAFDLIAGELADAEAQWSLGTFGAIAEFSRDAGEPADIQHGEMSCAVVTPRGGIRLRAHPDLRPVAFETIATHGWSQRVAFCLPEKAAAMSQRTALTEVGADDEALGGEDRGAVLFDLGLSALQADGIMRSADR